MKHFSNPKCNHNVYKKSAKMKDDTFVPNTVAPLMVPDGNGGYNKINVDAYKHPNGDISVSIPDDIIDNMNPSEFGDFLAASAKSVMGTENNKPSKEEFVNTIPKEYFDDDNGDEDPFDGYYYNPIPYDNMDKFVESQHNGYDDEYVDSVRYPGDDNILPSIRNARAIEKDYDMPLQYAGSAIRECNAHVVQALGNIHNMEMATLMEYITQQNLITMQTCLDMVNDAKNHK